MFAQMIDNIRDALGTTLSTVFLAGTLVLVVAFVLVFFLKELPLRTTNQAAGESAPQASSNSEGGTREGSAHEGGASPKLVTE
ncbi:hypothetical protein D3C86_2074290 [compost metagenome]